MLNASGMEHPPALGSIVKHCRSTTAPHDHSQTSRFTADLGVQSQLFFQEHDCLHTPDSALPGRHDDSLALWSSLLLRWRHARCRRPQVGWDCMF